MKRNSIQKLTLTGVMAALVFVMTYLPKVPVPVTGGYVHLGDGAIFLATLLLGPLGIPAAAIGSGLSDLFGGYIVYLVPTVIIKGMVAFIAWKLYRDNSLIRALLAFVIAELVMVLGYFAFESVLYGMTAAWAAVGPNLIQGLAGVVLGMVCTAVLPRLKSLIK